jgi:hypothetical protein
VEGTRLIVGLCVTALLGVGLLVNAAVASACDPMDCLDNPAPANAAEQQYLALTRIYGGTDAQRLQIGRATCAMLAGGSSPGGVVHDIARHLGTTNQDADQVMDQAMEDICPGLHLGG